MFARWKSSYVVLPERKAVLTDEYVLYNIFLYAGVENWNTCMFVNKQWNTIMREKFGAPGKKVKIVIVGNGAVGKTCMIESYAKNKFPGEYIPPVSSVTKAVKIGSRYYYVELHDTAGQEDYDRIRPRIYPNTDVFIICFSITSRGSFRDIPAKWYPEVSYHCPDVPIVLVANKLDLQMPLTQPNTRRQWNFTVEGLSVAKEMKAVYTECSALTQQGLHGVFELAVKKAEEYKQIKKNKQLEGVRKECIVS